MKSIECETMGPEEFIEKVRAAIAGREIGKIASFKVAPGAITVVFSKLGTTELTYKVTKKGAGFVAMLDKEKIAFAHRPFKADIEAKLAGVMVKCGGKAGA
jgi:hypothetical protein